MRGRIEVRLPYTGDNRQWLKEILGARTRSEYRKVAPPCWLIAREHYPTVLGAAVERWGRVAVAEQYGTTEKCTGSCMGATSTGAWDCTCVCGGTNHGGGRGGGWKQVGGDLFIAGTGRFWREYEVTTSSIR